MHLCGHEKETYPSDKTLINKNKAILNGKGLRFVDIFNIIIQNIKLTNLNPKYVWGGDPLSFSGTQNIWIDHVTLSSFHSHSTCDLFSSFAVQKESPQC